MMSVEGMTQQFMYKTGQVLDPMLYAKLIEEEFKEWTEATSVKEELKELADLVYVIYGYARSMSYDLDEAIYRVHENNLGRCIQPDGTVKRREDGKILKNKDYPKVDLKGCY